MQKITSWKITFVETQKLTYPISTFLRINRPQLQVNHFPPVDVWVWTATIFSSCSIGDAGQKEIQWTKEIRDIRKKGNNKRRKQQRNDKFWCSIHEFTDRYYKIHNASSLSILKILITRELLRRPLPIFVCVMVEIEEVARNFITPFFIESLRSAELFLSCGDMKSWIMWVYKCPHPPHQIFMRTEYLV